MKRRTQDHSYRPVRLVYSETFDSQEGTAPRACHLLSPEPSINFRPVTYAHHQNNQPLSLDLVDNAVVSYAQSEKIIFTCKFLYALRTRILRQRVDPPAKPCLQRFLQRPKLPIRSRGKFNPVGQLKPQLFLHLLPRDRSLFFSLRESLPRFFQIHPIL